MKILFGELNLTWPKVIIFAIIAGIYTGVVAQIPQARDTSFADISITFEWWILFGTIIIMNSKSNLDSALNMLLREKRCSCGNAPQHRHAQRQREMPGLVLL